MSRASLTNVTAFARARALLRAACVALALLACAGSAHARQEPAAGSLRGQVTDELGGAVVGANVTLRAVRDGAERDGKNDERSSANGERSAVTDAEGFYSFASLAPGRYRLRASARGFADSEGSELTVAPERATRADVRLRVVLGEEQVTVTAGARVEPQNNLNALVLAGRDLDSLPVGAGGLPAALHAIAALTAGPNGVQFYVDGFAGGRFPPREAIREVRINQNPFSAEYERIGAGRVEIVTKPGAEQLHGGAVFDFNDESLNSRNPFAPARAPYQSRLFGLNLGGPIVQKKASFFADFERRSTDDNAVVNALTLGPSFNVAPLSLNVLAPFARTTFGLRSDYQLTAGQALVGRYSFTRHDARNVGAGNFVLPERAYDLNLGEHLFQLSHTAAVGKRAFNEARLQHVFERNSQAAITEAPAVTVLDAFEGGGAQVGRSSVRVSRWELQNHTTVAFEKHALKFGGQFRFASAREHSEHNFNGTYVFAGGLAPRLDAAGEVMRDGEGQPLLAPVTSA
ncbi:MAG TPA: carboxypeptidase regulatory-like domain-containing protein, partial [Pyrinomonadaceae bacterium]|nr:carboxypeptidase regulatory-like domain-containing protein [Pyrinomonadaceae bacterium]